MIIQDESKLKAWISHLVEDISDAEPDALAKYVIALVKKPHSEADLEKLCSEKLSVFLQAHTEDFVVQLFAALKSGTYLTQTSSGGVKVEKQDEPEQDQKPEDLATTETDELVLTDPEPESEHELEEQSPTEKTPPKKMTTPSKSKDVAQSKRETKPSPRIESSRPSKEDSRKLAPESFRKLAPTSPAPVAKPIRKRISPPRATSAERRAERRQSPIRRRVIVGNVGGAGGGLRVQGRHYRDTRRAHSKSRSRSPHIRKEKRPDLDVRRRRCRDFHEKGYCMRGDGCPYDHGPDPVVVEDSALEKMVRTGTVFDQATTYGVNPPPPGMESAGSIKALTNITEGYNPEAPALTTPSVTVTCIDFSVPPPPIPQMVQRAQLIFPPGTAPPTSILPPYSNTGTTMTLPVQTTSIYGANPTGQINTFASTGNGMMMRGGRYKPYSMANRNPASRSLLVKKVPPELNKIAQLDQHFSKFGQVTNVQVQYEGRSDTALVTFKTRRDAMMAYKSTEPIFNNRFIKVFWQNDTQAQTVDGEGAPAEGTTNAGMVAESGPTGPTIPLSTGPVGKPPRIMPRCFTKTFAKPVASVPAIQQPSPDPNTDETVAKVEPTTAETMPTTTTDAATSSSSGPIQPTSTAPPNLPQYQARPMYGSPRAMAMKRKNDKEKLGKLMELHKMKADLYAKLVDQQKMLLQKLKNTEDKEQKKKLMEFLKKAEGPAKKAKSELEELGTKIREAQQRQQTIGPKKRRMSLITGQPSASNDNGQQTENGAAISSPKPNSPNKKLLKLCRVVYVSNCPPEHSEKLIIHMEKFGDLFDYDINMEPHMFTYKNPVDAQTAVADAVGSFTYAKLQVEWAPTAKNVKSETPVIPDRERKPSEQITPKDLLASLDYEEDEEEGENAPKEEESEEAGEEE